MTEGSVVKAKRNTRIFKNPPQPHMCIQDYMQGSDLPCYINVLSWDKIAMPCSPAQAIPLYGGMRLTPPRGEKQEVGVFAVIANPELLKLYGKNAQDPKERSTMIEFVLGFVEARNEGVYFSRKYTILKDCDITGELKEVWNAVQAKRDRENLAPQQETWIDAQPPAPQYPQYSDQPHQQKQQQLPLAIQQDYGQPPQYLSNATYSIDSSLPNEAERENRLTCQQQNRGIAQNERQVQICLPRAITDDDETSIINRKRNKRVNAPQYPQYSDQQQQLPSPMQQQDYGQPPQYLSNSTHLMDPLFPRVIERENQLLSLQQNCGVAQNEQIYLSKSVVVEPYQNDETSNMSRKRNWVDLPQNLPQPNYSVYLAYKYELEKLPRQMVPQYVDSNIQINANPNYSTGGKKNVNPQMNQNYSTQFQDFPMMQQQATEQMQLENAMHADAHQIQQQQRQIQQQNHIQKQQQQSTQQQTHQHQQSSNHQLYQSQQTHQRQAQQQQQQMQINNTQPTQFAKNILRSPKQGKPHMGVAQKSNANKRQTISPPHSKQPSCSTCQNKESAETPLKPKSPVRVLLRQALSTKKHNTTQNTSERNESVPEKTLNSESSGDSWNVQVTDLDEEIKTKTITVNNFDSHESDNSSSRRKRRHNNGTRYEPKQLQYMDTERLSEEENNAEEMIETLTEIDTQLQLTVPQWGRNDSANKQKTDSPKRNQSTVNSIIKSVFKINPGNLGNEAAGKRKSNIYAKSNVKAILNDQDKTYHQPYTILKKPEASTISKESTAPTSNGSEEEITKKFAQISIEDCKDATKVNAVLS